MRISSDPRSPDYHPSLVRRAVVFLDDAVESMVVLADEEEGFIESVVLDRRGNVELDGDKVRTVVRYGRVRLVTDNWQHVNDIGFDRWRRVRLEGIHQRYLARIDALPRDCPGAA